MGEGQLLSHSLSFVSMGNAMTYIEEGQLEEFDLIHKVWIKKVWIKKVSP